MHFLNTAKRRKLSALSDHELVQSYRTSGESDYLGAFFQRHLHLVYGICLQFVDETTAEDICMQVFERLIHSVSTSSHPDIRNYGAWLNRVTRNTCLSYLRKQQTYSTAEIQSAMYTLQEEGIEYPEEDPPEDHQNLHRAMEALSPEQRSCIQHFYFDNMSYQEIARHTGFPLKKVKSYLQNGRRRLGILLEK